jgi:L-iduronidase
MANDARKFTIDAAQSIGALRRFWCSTGFTPARLLLADEMRQLLQYLGSVPHGGIRHVRIHYLLELLRGSAFGGEAPHYDWSLLDRGLDVLVENRLAPFFELMGNPGGYFTDYEKSDQVHAWRRLVRDLARHCIGRYGIDEVLSWYFETWNEPDVGWWKQSDRAFHNYYDACSAGLADVDPRLRMGGPGTCQGLSDRLKSFLAHCDCGTDFFTAAKGVRLDFISVHEKGAHSNKEDLTPDMRGVCQREADIVAYIRRNHPRLADVPFMNNECDPQVGWHDTHTWHAKAYYAAQIPKVIDQHQRHLVDELKVRYELLSNDNGFVGAWGHRTHLALFANAEDLTLGRFEQIKKPCLNAMTMLSLLGESRLKIEGLGGVFDDLGAIATRAADGQVAVLVYNHSDRLDVSGVSNVEVEIKGLPAPGAMLARYCIDDAHGAPYWLWERGGAPAPDRVKSEHARLFAEMRSEQELTLVGAPAPIRGNTASVTFDLAKPGLALILVSPKPSSSPGRINGLKAHRYHGLFAEGQVMLTWPPLPSRVVRTYEVLHAANKSGPFVRVNAPDLLCGAFLHVAADVRGFYQVRAADYWGRSGESSETIEVS